jgi:AcrR family transcriptional regulator
VTAEVRRARGRPPIPRDVQRKRLIDAALAVVARGNYDKTTVADIVREAGMSSRSFYQHFASKEDMVAEILEEHGQRFITQLTDRLASPTDPLAAAERAIRTFLELFPIGSVDLERLGGEGGQRAREVRRKFARMLVDMVERWLVALKARGAIQVVPERAEIELVLYGIEALSVRYYGEGRRDELLALRPLLLRLLLRALGF